MTFWVICVMFISAFILRSSAITEFAFFVSMPSNIIINNFWRFVKYFLAFCQVLFLHIEK
ncbi:MAG: hypothetical protein COS68_00970 [Elusimicrobia bacterium CG06_land_8_20_14_3_00_38_11]|nr:MAG: hypothetical protein COS68_00970 [Elusimicrobia bacterium CG06_land_8_20_14_3_00_38_11]